MQVIVSNDKIIIEDASDNVIQSLSEYLTYTDKSKEYQLRKMQKNPFTKHSPFIKKLEKEVNGTLLHYRDGIATIPPGFAHLFDDFIDEREDTGEEVILPWNDKPFDPRPYQQEAVDLMMQSYRGIINLATGMGKTLTAVHAIKRLKLKTLVVCPNVSIANNFYSELVSAFGEKKVGYVGNGKNKIKDITVGIAQSVSNKVEDFKKANLGMIIFDEVHHLAANTFFSITVDLGNVGRVFGLTATAFRSDGKDIVIEAGVGKTLIKRDLIWGIREGYLAKPVFIVRDINTTGRQYKEDKLKNYKEHVLKSKVMNDMIVKDIQTFVDAGKSVLCLVSEISHGAELSSRVGLEFANGKDKKSQSMIDMLNRGKLPGLIGTGSFIGEGCDTKNVDVLILANFVANKGTLWQNIGRGLRIHNNQNKLIVVDYIPNGSDMLKRHAYKRIKLYREITDKIKIV